MKKKKKGLWLIPVALLLALAAAGFAARWWYTENFVRLGDVVYSRDTQKLDLSVGGGRLHLDKLTEFPDLQQVDLRGCGVTREQYLQLQAMLPGCELLWEIPFQGYAYPMDTEVLEITQLTEADIPLLAQFENLTTINALSCEDYAMLETLMAQRPDLQVNYSVTLGEASYAPDITQVILGGDMTLAQVAEAMPWLKQLNRVFLTGTLPELTEILAFREQFPQVVLDYSIDFFGQTVNVAETTELDISDTPVSSIDEVDALLPHFASLQKLVMCRCGIPSEEMAILRDRNPHILVVWEVNISPWFTVRTDIQALMPYQFTRNEKFLTDAYTTEFQYLTELICIDLGHSIITDFSFLDHMTKMEYLLLADCGISDISCVENMPNLKFCEIFMTNVTDFSPLLNCTKLEDLNIAYCNIPDIDDLSQMTWLQRLWCANLTLSGAEKDALRAALPNTNVCMTLGTSTGDGWRESPNYYAMRDLLGMEYSEG